MADTGPVIHGAEHHGRRSFLNWFLGTSIGGPPPKPLESFNVNLVSNEPGRSETIVISRA